MGLRSGLCAGQSSSSTPISTNHFRMDLTCHAGTGKGLLQTVRHKVGNTESSRMSLYAVELRFPFTGTKLPTNNYCADVASRGNLELSSECCNQGQIIFTHFRTRQSRSVSLCGLPLRGWAVVAPRRFHFTITALGHDLLERWHPMTWPCYVESH